MTGYQSKKAAASAKTIDEVNWADHEPNGLAQTAQEPVDDYTASIIAARDLLDAQPVPDFSYIKTYETKSPKN
jgi:hypothetical protein